MTLHFIHIGKTGGTAVKRTLKRAELAYWEDEQAERVPETPYGRIQLHHHRFRMVDVPPDDYVFFSVRDPVARFVSGFNSRFHEGRPGYYVPWTISERKAFEAFPTAQSLANALDSDDQELRERGAWAMRTIRHLGFQTRYIGSPRQLRAMLGRIVYIARHETLARDWEDFKESLGLPAEIKLARTHRATHRGAGSVEMTLDARAVETLRSWYARDYRLVNYCDRLRAWNHWGVAPTSKGRRRLLENAVMRLHGLPAVLPAPSPAVRRHLRWL